MSEERKPSEVSTALVVPEYFPSADFIGVALRADVVLFADTFRHSRQSRQNRCRVRTPEGGHWLTVPVTHGQEACSIREARVDLSRAPLKRHWKTLTFNYQSAPYFEYYEDEVRAFFERDFAHLGELAIESTRVLCALFGVEAAFAVLSEEASDVGGWASPALHGIADGLVVLDRQAPDFLDASIRRHIGAEEPYRQNFSGFVGGLSALDILFNLGPHARLAVGAEPRTAP